MKAIGFVGLLSATALWAAALDAQSLTNADARARAEPFSETVFGVRIEDPYRWMEQADRADEVTDFIQRAGAHTRNELAALPGRSRLRGFTAAAFAAGTQYIEVDAADGRIFYRRTDPGAQFAKLVVREADGSERVLFDPEAEGARGNAINGYSLSPDGRLIAFHMAAGGAEVGAIRFIEVETGRILPDTVGPVWGQMEAAWIDGSTVIVPRMSGVEGGDPLMDMQLVLYRIGGDAVGPSLLGSEATTLSFASREIPAAIVGPASEWVIGMGLGARADQRLFVAGRADLRAGRPAWRELAGYDDQISAVAGPIGDMLYLLSSKDASNRQVLRVDLAGDGGLDAAETIVPAGDRVLTEIAGTRDGVYVASQRDGVSGLSFHPHDGSPARDIALPLNGALAALQPTADLSGAIFLMQDWFTAPRWFRAEGAAVGSLGLDWASYAPARAWTRLGEQATSADGTQVPLAILLPGDHARRGPLPMLLQGYGGYGTSSAEPRYTRQYFGLIEEGAGVAFCGTRGGGERGRAWHEAGRGINKPNAHADLIACGERLVQLGLTAPGRMTVLGGSAGGMLAPPAALRRPDLFRSLIASVPILNPIRLAVAPNGPNQFAEMGDPGTEEGFRGLLSADAYQMLADAADMPDTMLVVGLNDNRVAPWFSAKFAARALDNFGDRRLVLLRTDPQAGHGIGSANDVAIEMFTDIGAFVLNRAGQTGFSGSAE